MEEVLENKSSSLAATPDDKSAPRILVGIASYGRAQDHFLQRLLEAYRSVRMPLHIAVLTNEPKPVDGAEVIAGLPSPDPYSLPFAHRQLFAEKIDDYDLFIYSEDDTLITEQNIQAFLEVQALLRDDEIAGFIRTETDPSGARFVTSIHHHFRWLPDSVVERGGQLFASLTNEHSGCFIATQKQLRRAIDSGGFLVPPHAEIYGMLETAASDLYTQCGLHRLVPISRIEDFIVPHLANKYYHSLGIPLGELELQLRAMRELHAQGGWTGKLFEPGSGAPSHRWSKDLYERPLPAVLGAIPESARRVLSVGCGWGASEQYLQDRGKEVCAVPLDAVLGASVRQRGIQTVVGDFEDVARRLEPGSFDAVLMMGVLHLLEDPVGWLRGLSRVLSPGGLLVANVANTNDVGARLEDWRTGRRGSPTAAQANGLQPVSPDRLRTWCRQAGLRPTNVAPLQEGVRRPARVWAAQLMPASFATNFLLIAERPRPAA